MLERCGQLTLLLLCCSGGCGHSTVAAAPANTLVLELGGANPSLQEAMQKLGLQPKSGRAPANAPAEPLPEPEPAAPAPAPESERVLEVKLEKGQNLYELARKHLGAAARWREIAEFNRFDEAKLNRLREGTLVRIPLRKN